MSYSKIRIEPPRFAAPYEPLVYAASLAARLDPLREIAASAPSRGDKVAEIAHAQARQCAHATRQQLAHALDLATGDEQTAEAIRPNLTRLEQTARTALRGIPASQNGDDAPYVMVPTHALLTSATDGHANEALRQIIKDNPGDDLLCDAAVELAMRIRTQASLRNAHGRAATEAHEGAPADGLIQLAKDGETKARNCEAAAIAAHNRRLEFAPSPKLQRHEEAAGQARNLSVAPSIYHHFDTTAADGANLTVLVYQHRGQRIAQLIGEPFPLNYPAARITEMCGSYIHDVAYSRQQPNGAATAHIVGYLANWAWRTSQKAHSPQSRGYSPMRPGPCSTKPPDTTAKPPRCWPNRPGGGT